MKDMRGGAKRGIAIVTSLLGGGGAERTALTMAGWWAARGQLVSVFVLRADTPVPEYPIPEGVRIVRLSLIGDKNPPLSSAQVLALLRLRQALVNESPRVVVSFIDKLNVAVLLALTGTSIPVVATEHLAPWVASLEQPWVALRALVYAQAMAVVSPTSRISAWFAERQLGRFATLPFPALSVSPRPRDQRRLSIVLAAGRLVPQKGFDLLIDAWAALANDFPHWQLHIAGEGPERARLEHKIQQLCVHSSVRMLGAVNDLDARMMSASVFVLSSRHEAYPMVLCEALAAGIAVVAADCPTGPRELIRSEENGLLVEAENSGAMARSLRRVIADQILREGLGESARERARNLSPSAIMPGWDRLINAAAEAAPV